VRRQAEGMFLCLNCGGDFRIASVTSEDAGSGEIAEGSLVCTGCSTTVPIVRNIPRFVPSESYASSFGFQWNHFDRIQIDKFMHNDLCRDRFKGTTGWPARLGGHIASWMGGEVHPAGIGDRRGGFSFDLSSAVGAAGEITQGHKTYCFSGPFYEIRCERAFDKIFCMGVLQHCPDVAGAFRSMDLFCDRAARCD
jgi:uncharacterized protein YbaR (Trm112 family)